MCYQVKRTLSAASYSRFSSALKAYKANNDFMSMIQCMADIFGDDPCKHRLLRSKPGCPAGLPFKTMSNHV